MQEHFQRGLIGWATPPHRAHPIFGRAVKELMRSSHLRALAFSKRLRFDVSASMAEAHMVQVEQREGLP